MGQGQFASLIVEKARKYDLRVEIVAAIIWQESEGDPAAIRFEYEFFLKRLFWRPRKDLAGWNPEEKELPTIITEKALRAFSFGLMQVLGETARVIGFSGKWLQEIQQPEINLELGCKYLRKLLDEEKENYTQALFRYNGSKQYPPKIFDHVDHGRHRPILGA